MRLHGLASHCEIELRTDTPMLDMKQSSSGTDFPSANIVNDCPYKRGPLIPRFFLTRFGVA